MINMLIMYTCHAFCKMNVYVHCICMGRSMNEAMQKKYKLNRLGFSSNSLLKNEIIKLMRYRFEIK